MTFPDREIIPLDQAIAMEARAKKPPVRFPLVPFSAFRMSLSAPYLVKGILPRAGIVLVYGAPKTGKSFWTFDIAMHVALGREYRGHRVQQGRALWLALEGEDGIGRRVEAFRQNRLPEDAGGVQMDLLVTRLDLVADCAALVEAITQQAKPPAIIVIDTLNRSLAGSESSDADMAAYIQAADRLREAFSCLVLIIHHSGHNASRPRGHSSLLGAVDAQISVKRETQTGPIFTEVEFAKDGPAGVVTSSTLETVEIGMDDDGDPLTSCVIEPNAPAPDAAPSRRPTGNSLVALELLERSVIDEGYIPTPNKNIPTDKKVVSQDTWRTYFLAGYMTGADTGADKADTSKRAFRRASSSLQGLGFIGFWDGLVWIP